MHCIDGYKNIYKSKIHVTFAQEITYDVCEKGSESTREHASKGRNSYTSDGVQKYGQIQSFDNSKYNHIDHHSYDDQYGTFSYIPAYSFRIVFHNQMLRIYNTPDGDNQLIGTPFSAKLPDSHLGTDLYFIYRRFFQNNRLFCAKKGKEVRPPCNYLNFNISMSNYRIRI